MTDRKPWRASELNMTHRVSKQVEAQNKLRAQAWQTAREAELEAVVERTYDGMDIPQIAALMEKVAKVMAPYIAEFDRLFTEAYPAEFAKATLAYTIIPGDIPDKLRAKVRRDAALHISARKTHMLANSSSVTTETLVDITKRATDNPDVHEVLDRIAEPNRATVAMEKPGPAIGILAKLLPHPEEWGFAGCEDNSPLLPAPEQKPKALPAPAKQQRRR